MAKPVKKKRKTIVDRFHGAEPVEFNVNDVVQKIRAFNWYAYNFVNKDHIKTLKKNYNLPFSVADADVDSTVCALIRMKENGIELPKSDLTKIEYYVKLLKMKHKEVSQIRSEALKKARAARSNLEDVWVTKIEEELDKSDFKLDIGKYIKENNIPKKSLNAIHTFYKGWWQDFDDVKGKKRQYNYWRKFEKTVSEFSK